MNVCFFRHGPAEPEGERPLSEEGRRKTLLAARGVKFLDLGVGAIFSSPLLRARQTAEILAEVLGLPKPRVTPHLLPESSGEEILECLRETKDKPPLLVGHEPSLSAAVAALTGGAVRMKKAGLAVVELSATTPRPAGTLVLLAPPSLLRDLNG